MDGKQLWTRYQSTLCSVPSLDLSLDVSRMGFDDEFLSRMDPKLQEAFRAMDELEAGAIANPDEQRMVGHYWLRAPERAPSDELTHEIQNTLARIKQFAEQVHQGQITAADGQPFSDVLSIGIGGSALGPMFVSDALGGNDDRLQMHFLDNTDPDGFARVLARLGDRLPRTLCLVISKSGGTPETRNGMLSVQQAFSAAQLPFAQHAVAITGAGSQLDRVAEQEQWLARFPMWDWVGGRTSQTSAVGLLPAALQGLDIDSLLAGAAACDQATRQKDARLNPAALMALMWYHAGCGHGQKDLVVLPYKDRLLLFSRYLQQLIMESLGKERDLQGKQVEQGLAVYGNKGSTDQHAYVQQLREGINNFFVTFIRVLESGGAPVEVEPGVTAGDYLHGFLLGTRQALFENGRESMTLTIRRVDARSIGVLIALFERAVGLYASLVGINAYHQPGVEAGKKAAAGILQLQGKILEQLGAEPRTAEDIAEAMGAPESTETVLLLLEHLVANGRADSSNLSDAPASREFRSVGA